MSDEVMNTGPIPDGTPAASTNTEETPKKVKQKGKGKIILLVVVIVVVLLFGGGGIVYATQHSNPQFCNLICHVPMDPYVASYMDGTSVNPAQTDAVGALDITAHKESDQALVCVNCHMEGIESQIQEGIAWVSGNYTQPLEGFELSAKEEPKEGEKSGIEYCLRPECHEGIGSLADLKESTSDLKRNPHESHNGDQNCTNCHQIHEQSMMMCTQCHADAEVPDGWLTYAEKQQQIKEAS